MLIIILLGCLMAMIGVLYYLFRYFKSFDGEIYTKTESIETASCMLIVMAIFASASLFKNNYPIICGITLLIGFALFIDCAFFMERRKKKYFDRDFAINWLKEVGMQYEDFQLMSYEEQLNWLKTTPYTFKGETNMLVEDEEDLEVFICIMNKE